MKTFRIIGTTLLFVVVCGLVAACSSDDDNGNGSWNENGNGKGSVQSKRLAKMEVTSPEWNTQISYWYDTDGIISKIHTKNDDISFVINESTIAWKSKDGVSTAVIDNGRAQSMTTDNCKFRYDANGRLIEMDSPGWGNFNLTWNDGNITSLEQKGSGFDYDNRIDYSYSNYVAEGILTYELFFNPLTENNFLDVVDERSLFYTGACGKLSRNLPATATFYSHNHIIGKRTYEYKTNGEQITSVIIDGYDNDSEPLYDYPYMLILTWE